jgi:hypothetical protein
MMPGIRRGLLLILLLASLMVILPGCGGYREFIFREDNAHFSFEYPASYSKPYVDMTGLPELVSGETHRLIQDGEKVSVFSVMGFVILNPEYYSTNVSALLEKDLREYESGFNYLEFKLLERSQISVSGIQGEQIIFSHMWKPEGYIGQKGEPYPWRGRTVYFYSNGAIWEYYLDSPLSTADQANADFEHILQTFKILE